MAVSGTTEFDVNATPEQVMDAVAAIEELPKRSSAHQSAEVETRHPDGRPHRVRAKVSAAGFKDEEVTDYTWDGLDSVTWTLVSSSVQSKQVATYTLTPTDSGTHIKLDLEIGVKVPMPGFVLKRVLKSALDSGSKDFKKYVEFLGGRVRLRDEGAYRDHVTSRDFDTPLVPRGYSITAHSANPDEEGADGEHCNRRCCLP